MRFFSVISALCAFTASAAPAEPRSNCGCGEELYRAFSPITGDHFCTMRMEEYNNVVNNLGYNAEGVACRIYTKSEDGAVPLYRLYNPGAKDHFYTVDASERTYASQTLGYIEEGITGYVHTKSTKDTVPFYRGVYQADGIGHHFYTAKKWEMFDAARHFDYTYESVAAYVFPA